MAGSKPSLKPHLARSLALHVLLVLLIVLGLSHQEEQIAQQELALIDEVKEQERREEQERLEREKEAAKEDLLEELQKEFEELIADELEKPDEEELSQETAEDLEDLVEQADQEQSVHQLEPQALEDAKDQIRSDELDQMEVNLEEMQRDLVRQVVADQIRRHIAPELTRRIEQELDKRVGEPVRRGVEEQTERLRRQRLESLEETLKDAADRLRELKKGQDAVRDAARKDQLEDASRQQARLQERGAEVAKAVDAALRRAEALSPTNAEQARRLRTPPQSQQVPQALAQARQAMDGGEKDPAEQAARQASQDIEGRAKDVDRLARDVSRARRRREPDPLDREVAKGALEPLRRDLEGPTAQAVAEEALPVVANKVMKEVTRRLEPYGLGSESLRAALKSHVDATLRDEMTARGPDPEAALARTRDAFRLNDPDALRRAGEQLEGARRAIEQAAQAQDAHRDTVGQTPTADQVAGQQALAGRIEQVKRQARRTVRAARRATGRMGRAMDRAERDLRDPYAEEKAREAAEQLQHQLPDQAKSSMGEASETLRKAAARLQGLQQDLAEETRSLRQAAAAQADLAAALGPQQAAQATQAAGEAAREAVGETLEPSVARAAESINVREILDQAARQRLGKMVALQGKVGRAREAMAQGRAVTMAPAYSQALKSLVDSLGAAAMDLPPTAPGLAPPAQGDAAGLPPQMGVGTDVPQPGQGPADLPPGAGAAPPRPGSGQGAQSRLSSTATGPNVPGSGSGTAAGALDPRGWRTPVPGRSGAMHPGGWADSDAPWAPRRFNRYARFNREAYEAFVKDLRNRTQPGNYYGQAESPEGLDSKAHGKDQPGPAYIYLDEAPAPADKQRTEGEDEGRSVPPPQFESKAFGAAAMQETSIRLDGDLGDWGKLRHPMRLRYLHDGSTLEDGPAVYMRWSAEGFFFAYKVRDPDGRIEACPHRPWEGDCFEVFLDMDNERRRSLEASAAAHQFCFMPFGFRGDPEATFAEVGRNMRGMKRHTVYPDNTGTRGASRAKLIPGYGYSVECFLSRGALARKQLLPGMYVAVNFSVNTSSDYATHMQWSASKAIWSFDKPDTWGDVLLLGSDGKAKFLDPRDPQAEPRGVAPGDPLAFQVTDKDMDLHPRRRDRVAAQLRVGGSGESLFVVLRETGDHTGVFRGSVATQQWFRPSREDTLNVRGGDTVRLAYVDARAAYGERNRRVAAALQIGWPIRRLK
ncbi:MAG: sugar-binding protein [Candidatus Brocadiia bacterium]